ncbi:MAG: hypothetical protein ACNA74_02795 [Desulfurivibrio sp.]
MHKPLFKNRNGLNNFLKVFYASLFGLLAIDLFTDKHPYFGYENFPFFYSIYGFVACVILVLAAKYLLRPLIMRKENYYD